MSRVTGVVLDFWSRYGAVMRQQRRIKRRDYSYDEDPTWFGAVIEFEGWHTVEFEATINPETDQPECRCVSIHAREGGPGVTPDDLRAISLPGLIQSSARDVVAAWRDWGVKGPPVSTRRNAITPAVLTDVANAYAEGGAEMVERALHKSRSQAFRLIQRAKAEGYITDKGNRKGQK